jgi:hypothetical protein
VIGWQGSSTGRDRAEGFLQAMVDGVFARDTAAAVGRKLRKGPDRPGAIFAGNDHMTCRRSGNL